MNEKSGTGSISISSGTIIRAVLILVGCYLIWQLRDLVLVVLTSIVIASFVDSAVPFFKKIKIGRVLGVVILYVLTLVVLAGIFYIFAPLLITEVYNFAVFISEYAPGVDFLNYLSSEAFSGAKDIVAGLSSDSVSISTLLETSKAFITNLSNGFFTTLSVAFGSIFNVVLIVIVSFYLSIQEKGIEKFLRVILPLKHEEYIVGLWERTSKKIGLWVKGQLLLALLITILTYLVLSVMGIQYALMLSIIAGIMELIPYGIVIAVIPAVSFSYLSGGFSSALMVAGAYLIIHQFEVYLFSPLIIKRVTGLSPLVMILAVLIGLELAGFWGLILAIPGALLFMEIMNDIERKKISIKSNNE
ncbi:MAG TPA: AI-2E family transporter [Candidatus Paceibacterota bacterium]|nr:AI-2E family transporter [Candidatus Paceibacterota bacterium]HPT18078.1 AI-2E family transporter [Candidatus Paceibacterota bacterium]